MWVSHILQKLSSFFHARSLPSQEGFYQSPEKLTCSLYDTESLEGKDDSGFCSPSFIFYRFIYLVESKMTQTFDRHASNVYQSQD